jgi:hypothetical protein
VSRAPSRSYEPLAVRICKAAHTIMDGRRSQWASVAEVSRVIEQSIAVDADQQLVPGKRRAGVERNGFAAVLGEVDNTQPGYLARQLVQHFSGIVVTAVVDGDDLEGESSPKRIFPFVGKQCTISGIKDLADILDLAGARPHGRKLLAITGGRGFYIRDLRRERVRTQHCARKSAHAVPIEKRYGYGSAVGLSLPDYWHIFC